jgi:non-specific serine/threonine protein kinase
LIPPPPRLTGARAAKEEFGGLTRREREVAALIARGQTNREIAASLFIGEGTAATHVKHIFAKLGRGSRAHVAAWAVEKGLAPG